VEVVQPEGISLLQLGISRIDALLLSKQPVWREREGEDLASQSATI